MATKKFTILRSEQPHQPAQIQFLTHVPRNLSIDDAKLLIAELKEVLGDDAVESVAAAVASSDSEVTIETE